MARLKSSKLSQKPLAEQESSALRDQKYYERAHKRALGIHASASKVMEEANHRLREARANLDQAEATLANIRSQQIAARQPPMPPPLIVSAEQLKVLSQAAMEKWPAQSTIVQQALAVLPMLAALQPNM